MDITNLKECPDCASSNILYYEKKDQVICKDCGLIFEVLLPSMAERYRRAKELRPMGERPAQRRVKAGKKKAKRVKKVRGAKAKKSKANKPAKRTKRKTKAKVSKKKKR